MAAEALEALRRRQLGRHARRLPATGQRGGQPESAIDQRRAARPLQRRRRSPQHPAAQITAEHLQREHRQPRAQRQPQSGADDAQQRRLGQHQHQPLAGVHAQHPEQRQLRHPLGHRQRLHRKHQERAREQRHQREHGEVDAVGAREVGHALRRFVRRRGAHGVRQCQRAQHRLAVGARLQPQVDPAQLPEPVEVRLRAGQVDHRQWPGVCADTAAHRQRHQPVAGLHPQRFAGVHTEQPLRRRVQEHPVRIEQGQPGAVPQRRVRPRQQGGRQRGGHQRVLADQFQPALAALGVERIGVQLDHRAGQRDPGLRGDAGVERLVQPAAADGAQFHIRLAVDRAHRLPELGQRRGIDQVHREGQRHAQRDRQQGHADTARVVARLAGDQVQRVAQVHGPDLAVFVEKCGGWPADRY